jgi:hypothetical protein
MREFFSILVTIVTIGLLAFPPLLHVWTGFGEYNVLYLPILLWCAIWMRIIYITYFEK